MAQTAVVQVKLDATQATNTVENLNEQITETGKSVTSLKTELRNIVQELQTLEPGSARFQELSLRAGELRDQIQDTSAVVGQLAGNFSERLFRGITSTVQVGVAGFQAMSAAQALFGVENEELQQTLVKLNALLNLSQALETFSGLDQKIVEIRAAFQSLTVGTTAQQVAQTGVNTATAAGTVATTALGTAMKALPIIGLIATIGTLVYGIYQYVTANSKAAEEEKKRKEEMEALAKAQEEERKQLADSTGEFLLLIERLKSTNVASAERRDLLKEINAEYGTNLQNIQDETKFLEQLETVANNYIEYQRTKFNLQKNQEKFNKILEDEAKINEQLVDATARVRMEQARQAQMQDRVNPLLRDATDAVDDLNNQKAALQRNLVAITKSTSNYTANLVELNKQFKTQAELDAEQAKKDREKDERLRAIAEAQRKYNEILKEIQSIADAAYQSETALLQQRKERGEEVIDLVERERDVRIEAITKQYNETKLRIETEIKDREKRDARLRDLEKNYAQFLNYENTQRLEREKFIQSEIIRVNLETLGKLQLEAQNNQRQREIDDLEFNKKSAEIGVLYNDIKLKHDADSLKKFIKFQNQRLEKVKQVLKEEEKLQITLLENQFEDRQKAYEEDLIKNKGFEYLRRLNEKGHYEYVLQYNAETQAKILQQTAEQQAQAELIRKQTEDNVNQYALNEYEKLQEQKESLNTETNLKIYDATNQTNQAIKDETINNYIQIADYIAQTWQQINDIISEFQRRALEDSTQQLEDMVAMDKERIDSAFAAGLISKEQYDNEVEQLEQKKRAKEIQLARKAFEQKKALDIVTATIDGARAVLSAFAQTPGEIIIKSIAAGIAAAFAAVQIGIIASQKFRAAKGGIVPGDGSGQMDSVDAQLAPGEAVINEYSTRRFLPLLSAINEAGGGRSFMPDLPATNSGQKFAPVFTTSPNEQQIVRAYVVESDITDAQRRINRIERSTTF